MTIEEMKERKRALGFSNKQLADLSGVPLGTVQKIFGNVTKAPRRETILALEAVLKAGWGRPEHKEKGVSYVFAEDMGGDEDARLREVAFKYRPELPKGADPKRQGQFTLKDYYALPDDERAELIDGVLYNMTAPGLAHQTVALQIAHQFLLCMDAFEEKGCEVYISPVDVQLDMDDKTMVEPDVVVLCDMDKAIKRCIYGAPDFVLEVLSPTTRRRDLLIKLNKYWNAGCKEYWIVDPELMTVTVYDFAGDETAVHYTFDDKVPVRLSEGKCSIDFPSIRDRLARQNLDKE